MKLTILLITLILAGCASVPENSKFYEHTQLGVRAYETNRPALAVVLLRPGVMSYLSQDSSAYIGNTNLSEEQFNQSVDYLIVSSWEAGDLDLFSFLLDRFGVELHDTFQSKGTEIGVYGKVRIKQVWDCVQLEDVEEKYLEAARCWRAVGNLERSSDNFKAHYIVQELGRTDLF